MQYNEYCCIQKIEVTMNNIVELYLAFLTKKNIYDDVKSFRKNERHSSHFLQVIEWLTEAMKIAESSRIDEVITVLKIKMPDTELIWEAEVKKDSCMMTKMESVAVA